MRVDQSWQHRRATEIDGSRTRRNLRRRPDVDDPIAADHDDLVREERARARIEQPTRADRDRLRWLGLGGRWQAPRLGQGSQGRLGLSLYAQASLDRESARRQKERV